MSNPKPEHEIKALVDAGELLKAVDEARRMLTKITDPTSRSLVQLEEVMALARLSSLEEAQERYNAYGLAGFGHTRSRSLQARLKKDFGIAADTDAEREQFLREARDLYLAIAMDHVDEAGPRDRIDFEYNAINAVTLSHMIGELDAVADLISNLQSKPPLDGYYSWATRAELLLVLGEDADAITHALKTAGEQADAKTGAISTTLRQLSLIAKSDEQRHLLDSLRPGPVLHYSGHMIAPPGAATGRVLAQHEPELKRRIEARLDQIAPSVVFGSLASGADILVVEWALRRGCKAWVYIPFERDAFFQASIAPAGQNWVARAEACMEHSNCRITYLTHEKPVPDDAHAFHAASVFSMGAAILRAERDGAHPVQLAVWDGTDSGNIAGTASDRRLWPSDRYDQHDIDVSDLGTGPSGASGQEPATPARRETKALVFGDVKNFSKLHERELPDFVRLVLGGARKVFDEIKEKYPGDPKLTNTWGDGIFAVFDKAAAAADFALSLQKHMKMLQPELARCGLPTDLAIRLGLHFGVVYPLDEPVAGPNFFGEAVSRAARIEPITTAGRTFVSAEFAAALALEGNSPAIAEYVGQTDVAKKFGRFRLYRIRPK